MAHGSIIGQSPAQKRRRRRGTDLEAGDFTVLVTEPHWTVRTMTSSACDSHSALRLTGGFWSIGGVRESEIVARHAEAGAGAGRLDGCAEQKRRGKPR